MQKTKDGYRWTIRLSNKDYAQKEVIRMFEYLLATGEYATESDIFREGIMRWRSPSSTLHRILLFQGLVR